MGKKVGIISAILIMGILATGIVLRLSRTQPTQSEFVEPAVPTATPGPTIANPASTNCATLGGTLSIQKRGDGGEYAVCFFEDDRACEEWALFRKECPTGGAKTTGLDTVEQKYCVWRGGKTSVEKDAVCTLPNGSTCSNETLYKGTCPQTNNNVLSS
jgi:putative hemolysin